MEAHRKALDTEYENLLQQFSKELEKLQARHQQELDRKVLNETEIFMLQYVYEHPVNVYLY
jgi:hypothetical protein